jgi:hypothetical protein
MSNVFDAQPGDRVFWGPAEYEVYGTVSRIGLRIFIDWDGGMREPIRPYGSYPDISLVEDSEQDEDI